MRWPCLDDDDFLSDHQKAGVAAATAGRIGMLVGGPGSGKTATAARLVRRVIDGYGQQKICVIGPTGKSAVRITEAMQNSGVDIRATTIHSALKYNPAHGGFDVNERSPLPFSFIVVDEASMVSIPLMESLLLARGRGTNILLLGDEHQLAPVEHGAPLRDMLAAGVAHGRLTEIRRNAGRIVRACAEIRDNHELTPSPALDIENGENLLFTECDGPERQVELLIQLLSRLRAKDIDPIWQVQIICAVNVKSPLRRPELNRILQGHLNPDGDKIGGCPFRVGDKVVNRKNGKFRDHQIKGLEHYIANGEQGEVIALSPGIIVVRLETPDRIVNVYYTGEIRDEADKEDGDDGNPGFKWELSYACSGHVSQGSEWPYIISLVDGHNSAQRVANREYWYTVVSRAKRAAFLIGKKTDLDAGIRRTGLWKRKTFLVESIREERAGSVFSAEEVGELLQGVC